MVRYEYNFSLAIFDCELNRYCTLFFLGYSSHQNVFQLKAIGVSQVYLVPPAKRIWWSGDKTRGIQLVGDELLSEKRKRDVIYRELEFSAL